MFDTTAGRTLLAVALAGLLALSTAGAQTLAPSAEDERETDPLTPDALGTTVPASHGAPGAFAAVQATVPPVVAVVEPLSTGETVEDFYGYYGGNGHSATVPPAIVEDDVTTMFLFEGPKGLSLVVINDDWSTPGGVETAALSFDGLPADGSWIVQDDYHDRRDHFGQEEAHWSWDGRRTDGGAYRALTGLVNVTIDADLGEAMDGWHFVSGEATDPDRVELDPNATLHLVGLE